MCKALVRPFRAMASLKQKGGSGGRLVQEGKVKLVCPKALGDFQFPYNVGPHRRKGSSLLQQPPLLLSDLTQRESLTTHTPFI